MSYVYAAARFSREDTAPPPGCTRVNIADYERWAKIILPKGEFDYFSGGANDMITLRENR